MSTQSNAPRFFSWFPLNCPPTAATDADGIVFRFVAKDPVDAEDFLSYHELGLALQSDLCRRCALSVYKSLDVARDRLRGLQKRNPKRAERHIARGMLTPADGRMRQTGKDPDHYGLPVAGGHRTSLRAEDGQIPKENGSFRPGEGESD